MRIEIGIVALGVALGGCSSSSDGDAGSGGSCLGAAGVYAVHYEKVAGDCGDIPDSLQSTDQSGTAPADGGSDGCTGPGYSSSADGCTTQGTRTCPNPNDGGRYTITLAMKSADAARTFKGKATVTLTNADGSGLCSGTYDVTETKQ